MSRPSRSDMRLYVRALRQGWNIPAEKRNQIVNALVEIVSDKGATRRERTSAARALMQASRVELDAIRMAHEARFGNLSRRLEAPEGDNDAALAGAAGEDGAAGGAS